jgi:sugar/nucleoside kinase (ribokinase family)
LVASLNALRQEQNPDDNKRPLVLWEPAPLSCVAANLEGCLAAAQAVDVFSPNHLELLALFGRPREVVDLEILEKLADEFLDRRGADGVVVVIRAGEHGCLVKSRDQPVVASAAAVSAPATWIPPYYNATDREKIVDTTGAGNAFMGGFAYGYHETRNPMSAAVYGTVAASFALEQVGTPRLWTEPDDDRRELWNGVDPRERLGEIRRRLGMLEEDVD